MSQSLRKRFAGRENELKEKVESQGLSYLCDTEKITYLPALQYAENVLGIKNPVYSTLVANEDVNDVAGAFVSALFKKFQAMETQIRELRAENQELKEAEAKKKMVTKLQLMRLADAIKEG